LDDIVETITIQGLQFGKVHFPFEHFKPMLVDGLQFGACFVNDHLSETISQVIGKDSEMNWAKRKYALLMEIRFKKEERHDVKK